MRLKNTTTTLFTAVVLLLAVGMNACKSNKPVVAPAPIEEKEDAALFVDIINNQINFRTLSSRLNVSISLGTRSISSKATLKMVKDQALQVSIQPLFGIEIARLYINNDSVILLDRMNKRFVKESIDEIKKNYPVGFDFKTLQALLTNRLFIAGQNGIIYADYEKFSTKPASQWQYLLNAKDSLSGIEYSFHIDGSNRIVQTHLLEPKKNYSLEWQYQNFVTGSNKPFPQQMNIQLQTPARTANVGLEFSNPTIDENIELSATVPSGYSKATLSDVLKIITSF